MSCPSVADFTPGMLDDGPIPKRARSVARPDSAEKIARIAVVGAGSWSQGWHLPHLKRNPSAQITAIVDPAASTWSKYVETKPTKELGELYDVPVFTDFERFLGSNVAAVTDGVIIASSHSSHAELGLKAIKAGLHVLMEKPMTTDVQEAQELVDASASSATVFMVNNSANFRKQAMQAHELVKAGSIGKVEHVSCYMMREREFFDDPRNTEWVSPSGTMLGNGMAWGQLSHTLAWIFMVTGMSPMSVFCHMGYSAVSGADIYDSASIRCLCGATISVQGVAGLAGGNSVGTRRTSGKLIENKIFGTEGCILYSGDDANPTSGDLILNRHDGKDQIFPGFAFENTEKDGHGPESLQAFIGACLGRPVANAADAPLGLKVVQVIAAMYKSAKTGSVQQLV